MEVFVLNKDGKPLMPTTRCGHVRILLNQKKAKVACRNPFTIQLKYETTDIVQPLYLGIDSGRTNIGVAVVKEDSEVVLTAKVATRNKEIPKLMKQRKDFRSKHRFYKRRKKRQRRAIANNTVKAESFERYLPHYEKPITCHYIKNKEAKFCNRKRPAGWLTPTANQLLQTHINIVKKLAKFLPITKIVIEVNKFAFMQLDDNTVKGIQFQNGPLKGYKNVEAKIYELQEGHCLLCKKPIDHYHHVVPRHKNGSEVLANRCGLCEKHHSLVHTDEKWKEKLEKRISGCAKKYAGTSVLNQIFPKLLNQLSELYPNEVYIIDGKTTHDFREKHNIKKDHHLDAYCIACSILETDNIKSPTKQPYLIKQYRRQDRQCCHKENVNRRYLLDGKVVAINRHKALEQKEDSLEEYIKKGGRTDILTVKEHNPVYKRTDRYLPGTAFLVNNQVKILKGSVGFHNGKPDLYKFEDGTSAKPKDCKFLYNNTGLVFVSNTIL